MKRRWFVRTMLVLLLGVVGFVTWLVWSMFEQLNNSVAVQRCALRIQRDLTRNGILPANADCSDYWGSKLWYGASSGRFVVVSFGRDGVQDTDPHVWARRLADGTIHVVKRRNCFSPNVDTVFAGIEPIQFCLK
ncbi:MAG: hypothetical protein ABIQ16_19635 [Polyangiaceae bacterium]